MKTLKSQIRMIRLLGPLLLAFFVCMTPQGAVRASAAELPFSFHLEKVEANSGNSAQLHGLPSPEGTLLIIWFEPAEGYYTYAHQPGGSALPTVVKAAGNAAQQSDPIKFDIAYPEGVLADDVFEPGTKVRLYQGRFPVFLWFEPCVLPDSFNVEISLLACSRHNCYPVKTTIQVDNRTLADAWAGKSEWTGFLSASRFYEGIMTSGAPSGNTAASAVSDIPKTSVFGSAAFEEQGSGEVETPSKTSIFGAPATDWDFSPQAFQASLEVRGLGKALLFGLLAGLILNIMPCVLPVLTLKVSSLLAAGGEEQERLHRFREHNLLFSAGIMTWFAALALLFGMAGMAWGQLFQNSAVVFGLMLLVFALGLAMFDVFHLPVLDLRVGAGGNPRVQAYTTGLFATLLATPCSGPLLGGVLGWSLMQSLPVLLTVFMATGLGMSLPYLLMAWKPAFANRLPRAGAWMLTFERMLGFFLMATVIYLVSILPSSMTVSALITLLAAAIAAWIWGKWGGVRTEGLRKAMVGAACAFLIVGSLWLAFKPPRTATVTWRTWDAASFAEALGDVPLLVEFTADWCPTCKVLERTTLTEENLSPLVKHYGLILFKVDMTRENADAQSFLRALDSASIPLLAVFPEGDRSREPILLRDIYSAEQMRAAVRLTLNP